MTPAPACSPLPDAAPRPSAVWPLFVWLGLQLLALLVAAGRVPLSKDFPRPGDQLAAEELAVVQIAASALLFPWLLGTASGTCMVIAASWPFTYLAGLLSADDLAPTIRVGVFINGWLLGLALWRSALRCRQGQMTGVAVATLFALGGVLLWYLNAEFRRASAEAAWPRDSMFGPILSVIALLDAPPTRRPWFLLGGWVAAAAIVAGVAAARRAGSSRRGPCGPRSGHGSRRCRA